MQLPDESDFKGVGSHHPRDRSPLDPCPSPTGLEGFVWPRLAREGGVRREGCVGTAHGQLSTSGWRSSTKEVKLKKGILFAGLGVAVRGVQITHAGKSR